MRQIWERLERDLRAYRYAVAGLVVYFAVTRLVFGAFCPMVIMTGLPCPGCGLNRAVWFLLTGQFARSFSMHPLAICWLTLLIWFAGNRYVAGKRMSGGMLLALAGVCAATLCLYGYRMVTLFPHRPPMSYTGRNLSERLIPGYRAWILTLAR